MKKAASRRRKEPSPASLAEMPEVDFARYRVRKNRFAARIAAEGSALVHDGPSPASVAEIPEVDLRSAKYRKNPWAKYLNESALAMHTRRGRPARGEETGPTVTRSIRLPVALDKALAALARAEDITVHALMRNVLASRVRAELASLRSPFVAREGRPAARPAPRKAAGAAARKKATRWRARR
ncbi:MAG TPA: hypothetical protein VNO30_17655 [Kofleriaceae bacterium]|nr:hypothetical protein [Kofleriaceae bacterium]